jgi:hypothetical protein
MAIVRNLGNGATPIDVSYCVPMRANAGPPASSLYAGELVYDSTAKSTIVNVGSPTTPYWAQFTYGQDLGQVS